VEALLWAALFEGSIDFFEDVGDLIDVLDHLPRRIS
jgi:hypothetical protein